MQAVEQQAALAAQLLVRIRAVRTAPSASAARVMVRAFRFAGICANLQLHCFSLCSVLT